MTILDAAGREIVKPADPIITDQKYLHQLSLITTWDHIKKIDLIARIKASTEIAWTKGVGLAAIQIGEPIRAAWFTYDGKEQVLVNPIITMASNPLVLPKEGCLSIPDSWPATRRYGGVTITNETEEGRVTQEFTGFAAIIVQHEIDHMDGILNFQRRYIPSKVAGRNDPCPCGSGLKYKKCCIDKLQQPTKPEEKSDEDKRSDNSEK